MKKKLLSLALALTMALSVAGPVAAAELPEGWKLYLLSSHTEFERTFGKRADKKRKLYNGMLKCDLFMYL